MAHARSRRLFQRIYAGQPSRLYESVLAGGELGAPKKLDELTTAEGEGTPVVTDDGLTLYYSTSRPGGNGGTDIW